MQRAIIVVVVSCACVTKSGDTGRRPPAQGALAVQDSGAPFAGTLEPVRRPATSAPTRAAELRAVRARREPGFDRVVFEFSGSGLPGYQVQYATEPIRACGSGAPVPLAGAERLVVRFEPAQAHDALGRVTADRTLAPRLQQLLELKLVCDFEGQVEWAAGLVARRPFRVLEDSQPPRVTIDVRHRE